MSNRPAFRLGLDLDGIFADFNTEAALTIARLTGRTLAPNGQCPYLPHVWDWMRAVGYKKSEIDAFWRHVEADPSWWADLLPYRGTREFFRQLDAAIRAHVLDVFFLTTRPAYNAHWQCVQWVKEHGIEHPQVAIAHNSASKGLLAAGLQLGAYVDDYAPNLTAVRAHSPGTALGFYVQPWGDEHTLEMVRLGAHQIPTLEGLQRFVEHCLVGGSEG